MVEEDSLLSSFHDQAQYCIYLELYCRLELMALLNSSMEDRLSSSFMTGRLAVQSTAASEMMFSLEYRRLLVVFCPLLHLFASV